MTHQMTRLNEMLLLLLLFIPIARAICSCSDNDDGSTLFRLADGEDVT